jgi:hypothetical protein
VANLPYKFPQSLFVKNSNWADSTQKVTIKIMKADDSPFADVLYATSFFEIKNPAATPTLTMNNVTTHYLLIYHKGCLVP